jgi:hypothetical protein
MVAMRGWRKVLLWAVILLACAAVGAFLASRSNPFPPEVRDASPSLAPSPTTSPEPSVRWRLTMTGSTSHTFRVGGACTSDWRLVTRIRVAPGGLVGGLGVARLRPGAGCDFETAQVQASAVRIGIEGRRVGDALRLRFRVTGVEPSGAQDLGALGELLPRVRVSLRERDGGREAVSSRRDDPNGDAFAARLRFALSG